MDRPERYKGILAKPLDPFAPSSPTEQVEVLLIALMDLFGINPKGADRFRKLSLALAFTHVPAFQLPDTLAKLEHWHGQQSGRKSDLSQHKSQVVFEVENAFKETKNITAACRKLTRGKLAKFRTDAKRLERAYYRYRKELKGFERLAGVPFTRLCANYPKSCVSGESYVDETLTACAHPNRCRLYSAYQEAAKQLGSGTSERGQIAERLRLLRSLKGWAMPNKAGRRARTR